MISRKICNNKPENQEFKRYCVKIKASVEFVGVFDSRASALRYAEAHRNELITDEEYVAFEFDCEEDYEDD